jgi:hypothetical protein
MKAIHCMPALRLCSLVILTHLLFACGGSSSPSVNNPPTPPPANSPPTANAGSDQSVDEQSVVTLSANGSSDSDGTIASYLWTQNAGSSISLNNSTSSAPTFTAPTLTTAEILSFQLTVTDNDGAVSTDSVNVEVIPVNTLPVAHAGDNQTVDELTEVSLSAAASSDADGSIISYAWTQTLGLNVNLNDSSLMTPTFTAPDIDSTQTFVFSVVVTDNEGGSASASVEIIINPITVNSPATALLESVMLLNQLYFEYADRIGEKIWVLGYYGNTDVNGDGLGFLVDNMLRLEVDEQFAHHSFARLDGALPPDSWHGNQILVYGEVLDYASATGKFTMNATPMISVEKYELVSLSTNERSWQDSFITPDLPTITMAKTPATFVLDGVPLLAKTSQRAPGTQAQACDRSIIISGGVDDSNNHQRYIDNVIAKFNKMKDLGFNDDQIEVFYNNGGQIMVEGSNVVDAKTSMQTISEHINKIKDEMPGSCTLTIFVTDHGSGFNQEQGYHGARPALTGSEATSGKLYDENSFVFDARKKTYRVSAAFAYRGAAWFVSKEQDGTLKVYKRVGETWQLRGTNSNNDDIVSETELNGEDINGDGDTSDADYGLSVTWLEGRLTERQYRSNQWDTDGNGIADVRLRWDGTRFVVERLNEQGEWQEMGRDTNGDYFIDILDGGVDWNLDGDKADQIGFHESINLWGNEQLFDDAFADLLSPLAAKGIHIMMEMVSCFSGGFIDNLQDYVENIYTGASEDTKHYNRYNAEGKLYAADEIAFLENLVGIDTDSWNAAADAATGIDDIVAQTANHTTNVHLHYETPRFVTGSLFQRENEAGKYTIKLDLPDDLVGQIYDFEFILGLQTPRWTELTFPDGLPNGWQTEAAPGGIRVFSDSPITDEQILSILVSGPLVDDQIRIEFTDVAHQRLGYTMVTEGEVVQPAEPLSFAEDPKVCVNHSDHGQSSPSILEWLILANSYDKSPFVDIEITLKLTTPVGEIEQKVVLNEVGQMYVLLQIFTFGAYELEVTGARLVATDQALELVVNVIFPFTVTGDETNKGQCNPD